MTRIFWHSKDHGEWKVIKIHPNSIIAGHLHQPEAIYDDGYGNRYKFTVEENSDEG